MPPAIAVIEKTIDDWIARIARIGKSIETLSQNPAFLRLKTQSRLGALTGQTKDRAENITKAADELWRLYLILDKNMTEASALRNGKNPFTAESRYGRIQELISGSTIDVDTASTSLSALQLDGGPKSAMTLQNVYDVMNRAFCDIRDTVATAESGWERQAALDPARQKIAALEAEAKNLAFAKPPQLADAQKAIDAAQAAIDADPLGAVALLSQIDELIAKADKTLSAARADHAKAIQFLDDADKRLTALTRAFEDLVKLRDLRLAKIADPPPTLQLIADPRPNLSAWLDRLKAVQAAGRASAVIVGGAGWTNQIDADESAIASLARQDQKVLDARADLRGQFTALKARADDLAGKNQLSAENAALLAKTASLLFGAATPLPETIQLIKRCDKI